MAALLLLITSNAQAGWEVRVPYLPDDFMVIITSYSEAHSGVYYGPIMADGTAVRYDRLHVPAFGMMTLWKADIKVAGDFWLWIWAAHEFGVVVVGPEGGSTYYAGREY